eukprot:363411-Chlamydomonas_euryale.AAC.4
MDGDGRPALACRRRRRRHVCACKGTCGRLGPPAAGVAPLAASERQLQPQLCFELGGGARRRRAGTCVQPVRHLAASRSAARRRAYPAARVRGRDAR